MTWLYLMSLAVIGWIFPTHQTNPGLQLRLSQSGLNYAAQIAIDQMTKDIQGKHLDDISGKTKAAGGKVEYTLNEMNVQSFSRPTSSVVVNPGNGITWSLTGIAASIHGHWRYKYRKAFIKFSDSGSFDVSTSGASLTVSVAMSVDASGRPTIKSTSCSSDGGRVKVKFHGGASWLYNIFNDQVEKPLKKKIQELLCSASQKAINVQAAKQLAKLKVQVPVKNLGVLDYRLLAAPVFGSQFVETQHKGEFFWTANSTEAPFQPSPLPAAPGAAKMISIGISQYVLDTAGYVTFQHGLLQKNLTKDDLSPSVASTLNVTCTSGICIGSFIPQLKKLFPNGVLEIHMKATESPRLHINPGAVVGGFVGQAVFNVRMPNKELKYAFAARVAANMSLSVTLKDQRITASVSSFKNDVTITDTKIGPIGDKSMEFILNYVFKNFIKPKLDEKGAEGLVLPSIDDVAFVNPALDLLPGALYLQTDLKYTPKTTLYFKPKL